jgi:antitoxin FitA
MLLRMKTRMIQIRHVPEGVHRRLTERAKRQGMSLSDYLRRELTQISEKLTWDELFEEIDRDGPVLLGDVDTVETIRQGREERDRELDARILRDVPPEGSSWTPRWLSTS